MKRGLREPSLPKPEVAFAGQQPVAEQRSEQTVKVAFDEVALLCDQHFLNIARVVENDDRTSTESECDVIAVRPRTAQQETELIPTDFQQVTKQEVRGWCASERWRSRSYHALNGNRPAADYTGSGTWTWLSAGATDTGTM